MAATLRPLGEIFTDWPADVADNLAELATYDRKSLEEALAKAGTDAEMAELIFELRGHALDLKNAADREEPLAGPEAVANALGVTLSPPPGKWITYPLDASRRRLSAPHKKSGSRFLCTISIKVPELSELHPLPEGGVYLLVRRDGPEVLNIPGVIERIDRLASSGLLADCVFYQPGHDSVTPSTVYSLRGHTGARGRTSVPLELDPQVEQKARKLWIQ